MDYYSYFKGRFAWGSNPYTAMSDCQQIIIEMLSNPKIPFCISASAAVDFLSALADSTGNGYTVTAVFKSTMQALTDMCQETLDTTAAADEAWLMETQELEQEASGGPPYEPEEFETWPVDMDNGEDEVDGEDSDEDEDEDEDEPREPNGILEAIEEYLCSHCDLVAPGTRRPWPDWQHCGSWTSGDWVRFQIHKEKILAAAKLHTFSTMGTVTNAIAAASAHISLLPLPRRAEVALWCQELVDELYCGMESSLQELCAESSYTSADRAAPQTSLN